MPVSGGGGGGGGGGGSGVVDVVGRSDSREDADTVEAALRLFNEKQSLLASQSGAICAIETLLHFLSSSRAKTLQEVVVEQRKIKEHLCKQVDTPTTPVKSGCELFIRFITLVNQGLEETDFEKTKKMLVDRGANFLNQCAGARERISRLGHPFLRDGATVLTHSKSRVVFDLLRRAAGDSKRLRVFVTQSAPDNSGEEMKADLDKAGIQTTVILDSAVAYIMEKVDVVLVGAEGVVENGGIINKIGTYGVAIAAKTLNKPFYVAAESFKFTRLFPLSQSDLPDECKYKGSSLRRAAAVDANAGSQKDSQQQTQQQQHPRVDLEQEHPLVDYTPPDYITLLFTDLGVLTPTAVSDHLIDLYL